MKTILFTLLFGLAFQSYGQRLVPYLFNGEDFSSGGISQPAFTVMDAQVFQDTLFMISNDYSSSNGSPLVYMKQGQLGYENIGSTVQLPNTKFQSLAEYNNQLVVIGKDTLANGTAAGVIHIHEATGWHTYVDPSVSFFQSGVEYNGVLFLFKHSKARTFQNGVFSNAPIDSVSSYQIFQDKLFFVKENGSDLYYLDALNVVHTIPGPCNQLRNLSVVNDQLFICGDCADISYRWDPNLGIVQDDFGLDATLKNRFLHYKIVYSPYGNYIVDNPGTDFNYTGIFFPEVCSVESRDKELLRMTDVVFFENEWWAFGETIFGCPFQGIYRIRPGSINGKISNGNVWATIYPAWSNFYGGLNWNSTMGMDGVGVIYASAPVLNGINNGDTLGVDAIYHSLDLGFSSGPKALSYSNDYLDRYYRVWQVTQQEIDYHNAHWWESNYVAPLDLLDWPGNGNTANGEPALIAPFHDVNGNNIYEPMLGDAPQIKGDQAAFYIVNDGKTQCAQNNGILNGETQFDLNSMVYLFDNDNNTAGLVHSIYQDFRFIPRENIVLHDSYFGVMADFDVGTATDDYIGSDSLRNLVFAYNGDAFDQPSSSSLGFGTFPPSGGVRLLTNTASSSVDFAGVTNNNIIGWPSTEQHFYHYQQGLHRNGTPKIDPFTNAISHFDYPGEVGVPGVWNEVNSLNAPNDRRMMLSSYVGEMNGVNAQCFSVAYTMAVDSTSAGDSNVNSVALMKVYSDVAQVYFDQYLVNADCEQVVGVEEEHTLKSTLAVYPNPTSNSIQLSTNIPGNKTYCLYNLQGQILRTGKFNGSVQQIDVSQLSQGIYLIQMMSNAGTDTMKFEKN